LKKRKGRRRFFDFSKNWRRPQINLARTCRYFEKAGAYFFIFQKIGAAPKLTLRELLDISKRLARIFYFLTNLRRSQINLVLIVQ